MSGTCLLATATAVAKEESVEVTFYFKCYLPAKAGSMVHGAFLSKGVSLLPEILERAAASCNEGTLGPTYVIYAY